MPVNPYLWRVLGWYWAEPRVFGPSMVDQTRRSLAFVGANEALCTPLTCSLWATVHGAA